MLCKGKQIYFDEVLHFTSYYFLFFFITNGQLIIEWKKLLCLNVYITKSIFQTYDRTSFYHHHHVVIGQNVFTTFFERIQIKGEKIFYVGPSDSNNVRKIVKRFSVTVKRVCMYSLTSSDLVKVVQLAKKLSTYLPFC